MQRLICKITAIALLCTAIGGCSMSPLAGTESLLVAPILNKRQAAVSNALGATVPLGSIRYKYPQSGDYRSPFVFHDLDGDGVEEAVVLYTSINDANGFVRGKVFTQDSANEWHAQHDFASTSTQIEFIQFQHLLSTQASCMLIGFQGQERQSSTLAIYSFQNGIFQPEASPKYIRYAVEDFDNDGLSEVIVLNQETAQRRFSASLWRGIRGHIEPAGQLLLAEDVESSLSLVSGRLQDRSGVLYLDEALSGGPSATIATEVIQVTGTGLKLLAGGEPPEPDQPESIARNNYEETFRDEEVLCSDYDGDRLVEVPYIISLPGADVDSNIANIKLTQFMHLGPEGFTIVSSGVINADAGYIFYFPSRWVGNVTVERGEENNEWHFRKWDIETQEPAEELLRIQVSAKEYHDLFEDYIPLATRGTSTYSAYIPAGTPFEPLAVTQTEIQDLFLLLPS